MEKTRKELEEEKKGNQAEFFIIVDVKTRKALYGINERTLLFTTEKIAKEVGSQFFRCLEDFEVYEVRGLN